MLIEDKRYGNTSPIKLIAHRYAENDNICLRSTVTDPDGFEEPWCTYTVNMSEPLAAPLVAIKTWSENMGCEQVLLEAGVIEYGMVDTLCNGCVAAPVYKLTQRAITELGITV
jgi:hypothetical protein